ncbi:MAG: amino acid adenylation domain-containing protein [bacterium]|nr:amino acid adenylation domain-containing protein [bacterium]
MKEMEQLTDVYKLSPMQEGMLFHWLKEKNSFAYFEQTLLTLTGDIDEEVLEKSINLLIRRYDVLRTVFYFENLKQPLQIVLKERRLKMDYRDISHLKEEKREEYLEEFRRKDRERGFDLSKDLLMRVFLFKTGSAAYKLLWSSHHILMDGWCLGILFRDITTIYRSLSQPGAGGVPRAPEPAVPFRKYIEWLEKQDKEKGLSWWKSYLEGCSRPVGLPAIGTGVPGDGGGEYMSRKHTFEVGASLSGDLTQIARQSKVSLTSVFQILWGILLQKYNNTDDVVFGMVVSGRSPEVVGIESMVGLFINTVPLRIKRGENKTFRQLLSAVHRQTITAKTMEYLSLADIQAQSPLKNRLLDHLMVFQNYPVEENLKRAGKDRGTGFRVEAVKSFEQTGYDFNILIAPGKSISVTFNYNGARYPQDFIGRTALHFKYLMRQIAVNPEIDLEDLETITPEEKRQILSDFNKGCTGPGARTIHRLFEEQVDKTPDAAAVVMEHRHLTYKELNEKSGRPAARLREKGVGPECIVGLMVPRSLHWITGLLGILKAGGAFLPIDPGYPAERIRYMLADSRTGVLVSDDIEVIDNAALATHPTDPTQPTHPTQLSYVIYTSGTTGNPKGAMLEHKGPGNLKLFFEEELHIGPGDRVLQFAQITFDASVWEVLMALLTGACLYIAPAEAIENHRLFEDFLIKNGITAATLPPTYLVHLDTRRPYALRKLFAAGSESHMGLVNKWRDKTEYINAYGPTEITICAAWWKAADQAPAVETAPVPIGSPLPNTGIFVMNMDNRLQPVGVAGELCIFGTGLGRGYLNRVELTAETFTPHPLVGGERLYRTGDQGRWAMDGNIEFLGRLDSQVKIRGYRIELAEVEVRLLSHPAVKEAVVTAREDRGTGDYYLCAYIVWERAALGTEELEEYLSFSLPRYMVPLHFVQLEKLPLTPTGKVDRGALPEPGVPGEDPGEDHQGNDRL